MKKGSYVIDFVRGTITITKDFAKKAQVLSTEEAKLLHDLTMSFPSMKVISRSHGTPALYHNADGSITRRNQYSGLTYAKMEGFISALNNAEDLRRPFDFLRAASNYANVRRWFEAQFPYYHSNPLFYYNSSVIPIDATEFLSPEEFKEYAGETVPEERKLIA